MKVRKSSPVMVLVRVIQSTYAAASNFYGKNAFGWPSKEVLNQYKISFYSTYSHNSRVPSHEFARQLEL
jgi:hypothetical protein